jgi:hypothetical protein
MTPRALLTTATLAAATTASAVILAAPAQAGGAARCPTGYQLVSVAELTDLGYQVPSLVDDPTSGVRSFGQPGNGNGWVCAVPLGNQTFGGDLQIYNFLDDTLRS